MEVIKVLVGSKNPVKIQCTIQAFQKVFPKYKIDIQGLSVPSGVSDQPMTDLETLDGAQNRAQELASSPTKADYYVGIEGGLETINNEMEAFAWIYVIGKHNSKARTATFQLPKKIQELIKQGIELGIADDMVFKREIQNKATGWYTTMI